MGAALVLRPMTSLSVQHDRAPLFVRLASGAVRNGYTVVVVNKHPTPRGFSLTVAAWPNAVLSLPETDVISGPMVALAVPADSVTKFRVLLEGDPATLRGDRRAANFVLQDETGARVVTPSVFMGATQQEPAS